MASEPRPTTRRRNAEAGVTLIELMITAALIVVLAGAISYTFEMEVTLQRNQEARRASVDRTDDFERTVTRLIEGARLAGTGPGADATTTSSTTTAATTTGTAPSGGSSSSTSASGSSSTSSSGTDSADSYFLVSADAGSNDMGVDRITFTTTAPGAPTGALNDVSGNDFGTDNTQRGPVGGLTEVSLGTSAIGDAGGQTGLFERIQQPSDGDPTQGGTESVLEPDISEIGFQFWDGTEWTNSWDTTSMTTQRLPAAVQVSYKLKNDPSNTVHLFVVPVPASDVNANNPLVDTDTSGAATTSSS